MSIAESVSAPLESNEPRPVQTAVMLVGAVLAVALGAAVLAVAGTSVLWLYLVGLALGLALFHSGFGFTSAWRQLVAVRQGRALRHTC